jgi:hypothetical protein
MCEKQSRGCRANVKECDCGRVTGGVFARKQGRILNKCGKYGIKFSTVYRSIMSSELLTYLKEINVSLLRDGIPQHTCEILCQCAHWR